MIKVWTMFSSNQLQMEVRIKQQINGYSISIKCSVFLGRTNNRLTDIEGVQGLGQLDTVTEIYLSLQSRRGSHCT